MPQLRPRPAAVVPAAVDDRGVVGSGNSERGGTAGVLDAAGAQPATAPSRPDPVRGGEPQDRQTEPSRWVRGDHDEPHPHRGQRVLRLAPPPRWRSAGQPRPGRAAAAAAAGPPQPAGAGAFRAPCAATAEGPGSVAAVDPRPAVGGTVRGHAQPARPGAAGLLRVLRRQGGRAARAAGRERRLVRDADVGHPQGKRRSHTCAAVAASGAATGQLPVRGRAAATGQRRCGVPGAASPGR
jgi:hypothetical protein